MQPLLCGALRPDALTQSWLTERIQRHPACHAYRCPDSEIRNLQAPETPNESAQKKSISPSELAPTRGLLSLFAVETPSAGKLGQHRRHGVHKMNRARMSVWPKLSAWSIGNREGLLVRNSTHSPRASSKSPQAAIWIGDLTRSQETVQLQRRATLSRVV